MSINGSGSEIGVTERWNEIYRVLAHENRRMVVVSLLETPEGREVPLPRAAQKPDPEKDPQTLELELRHQHLPMMAASDFVEWEEDPFFVRRGPHFDEIGAVFDTQIDNLDGYPKELICGCELFEEMHEIC